MRPSGALMVEHRLIEKFIRMLLDRIDLYERTQKIDPLFTDAAIDFFKTYADRTHHGKEEGILFLDLTKKKLLPEHSKVMDQLIDEHIYARLTIENVSAANSRYKNGHMDALFTVVENFRIFTRFYPEHIKKEDVVFFPAAMTYFDDIEFEDMLRRFTEFDGKMIHEKYQRLVESFGHEAEKQSFF